MKAKNIGLDVEAPKEECTDKKCPFHGEINVKPETFVGRVVKKDVGRSATIEWLRNFYIKKYERYAQRKNRLRVHNPACIKAEIGDEVMAARTRPLSKTKNFVIIKIIKKSGSHEEVKPAKDKKKKTEEKKAEPKETEVKEK